MAKVCLDSHLTLQKKKFFEMDKQLYPCSCPIGEIVMLQQA